MCLVESYIFELFKSYFSAKTGSFRRNPSDLPGVIVQEENYIYKAWP